MLVLCATLNAGGSFDPPSHFDAWLHPLTEHLPDIVAVGFQESLPLPLALSGLSRPALAHETLRVLSQHGAYQELANHRIGAIQLLVFARQSLLKDQTPKLAWSTVGCGDFYMSNKGAVAVRLTLQLEDQLQTLVFVVAHLAAHPHKLERRNLDWQSIVQRLASDDAQIYQTDHLFVFGDLNYRLFEDVQKDIKAESFWPDSSKRIDIAFQYDQLQAERTANRTLHHLTEAPVTFSPTYKYRPGKPAELVRSRLPAWCDRVLYISRSHVEVLHYSSVMACDMSDHKPVSALYCLQNFDSNKDLPLAPFPVDETRHLKALVGRFLDLLIGIPWALVFCTGFGRADIGVAIIAAIMAFCYFYLYN